MEDGAPNSMNLDLNLGPLDHPADGSELGSGLRPNETVNLESLLTSPVQMIREAVRQRRRWRSLSSQIPIPDEARSIALELIGGSGSEGDGVAAADTPSDPTKMCDNNKGCLGDETLGKKEESGKGSGDDISFFDCNICLDLSKDPVVTCCGHLFCWPCLYRWLHVHSDARECPVCKGEVTLKNVTPIYGRGNSGGETEEDSGLKIPIRPQARRVESWRQTIQRNAFTIPVEEMIRRLGGRYDLSLVQPHNPDSSRQSPERSYSLLNRILTSRGMRREQNTGVSHEDLVDLTESVPTNSDVWESRPLTSLLRRSTSHRAASIANFTSALSSAERLVHSYFQNHPVERNRDQPPPVDDRDSVSSIAAVIQSESQTVETNIEIESNVSLSTSSSRRRNDASRISDVDSGDSRPNRRRRLN